MLLFIDCEKINEFGYNVNNYNIIDLIFKGKHYFCNLIQIFLKKHDNTIINSIFWNSCTIITANNHKKHYFDLYKNIYYFNNIQNFIKFDLNVLTDYSGNINIYETGFLNALKQKKYAKSVIYLLNCDDIKKINRRDYVIFQGHHNMCVDHRFNIILPNVSWLEKKSLFMNCFGMLQNTNHCIAPPINARIDWKITYYISSHRNWFYYLKFLSWFYILSLNLKLLDTMKEMFFNKFKFTILNKKNVYEYLNNIIPQYNILMNKNIDVQLLYYKTKSYSYSKYKNNCMPIRLTIPNYYSLTTVEQFSNIMFDCSKFFYKKNNNFKKIL